MAALLVEMMHKKWCAENHCAPYENLQAEW